MNQCLRSIASLRTFLLISIAVFCVSSSTSVRADVRLPGIISDHMVLQKSDKTSVWGWAAPGEDVTVTLNTQSVKTKADANGKWKVALNLSQSGPGPFQMTVAGKNQTVISDVLVGQVWVASGQSNMELPLKATMGAADEIAHSANSLLRQFFVNHTGADQPLDDCSGAWTLAGPSTAGDYSAAGYYFAKKLQNELKVPVAFINTSIGSTAVEQWTSSEGMDADPEFKAAKDFGLQTYASFLDQRKKYPDAINQWLAQNNREDKPPVDPANFAGMDIPTTDWTKITLPGPVAGPGLPPAGAIWIRKEFTLTSVQSADALARIILIYNAGINDYETVYWNGEKVVQELPKDRSGNGGSIRTFGFPVTVEKVGKNVLAIRFFSPVQAPQLSGQGMKTNSPPGIFDLNAPPLAGDWLAKTEYALPAVSPAALAAVPSDPMTFWTTTFPTSSPLPCQMFNGMIAPILPCTIAGVIWYQGEMNTWRGYQYRTAFPLMIKDWRAHWGLGDFPFYFCQLASLSPPPVQPGESDWAELRESQLLTLKLPNTGMAVLVDIGNPGNIHPRDKKDAGERLALIALAKTYHKDIPYSGPIYESNKIEGNKIRLSFSHTDGGLVAKPLNEVGKINYIDDPNKVPPAPTSPKSDLQGFQICGPDHKWVWADAKIDGTDVLAGSDQIPQPVAVRYAWAANPTCNLYNGADLPASPFRTDDFPVSTGNARYGK